MSAGPGESRAGRSRAVAGEVYLLRVLPWRSPLHRLWAGTKLLSLVSLGTAAALNTSWPAIGILAAVVLVGLRLAKVPRGVAPHLPRWLWAALGVGAAISLVAGGPPVVGVGPFRFGLASIDDWTRLTFLGVLVLTASALVGWTTPLVDVSPAIARLLGPLRRARVPVDELAVAVGLAVRALGLLSGDLRLLVAGRRLRPRRRHQPLSAAVVLEELVDVLVSALVSATRRARDLGDAIAARGGFEVPVPRGPAPGAPDLIALLAVAAASAAIVLV